MPPQFPILGAILATIGTCLGNPDAKRLYDDLLSNYNRLIRPVSNNSETVIVKLGLRLSQLIDLVRDFFFFCFALSLIYSPRTLGSHSGTHSLVLLKFSCMHLTTLNARAQQQQQQQQSSRKLSHIRRAHMYIYVYLDIVGVFINLTCHLTNVCLLSSLLQNLKDQILTTNVWLEHVSVQHIVLLSFSLNHIYIYEQ